MHITTGIAAITVALVTTAAAAVAADPGPAIGTPAPALTAVDTAGRPQTLTALAGRNGTVLVFVRSAKWCPYCQRQLGDLKAAAVPLAARGYKLAAISYDSPATLAAFAAKQAVTYPLLSDAGSKTIDRWALRDPQYATGHFAEGVPKPAIFVIDRRGVIRGKLAEDGYKSRPPVSAVLALVDGLRS